MQARDQLQKGGHHVSGLDSGRVGMDQVVMVIIIATKS
jgi:hypothetical protein